MRAIIVALANLAASGSVMKGRKMPAASLTAIGPATTIHGFLIDHAGQALACPESFSDGFARRTAALLEAIQKADTLIEALGWIRRFRDKITVIKLGGSVMEHENALRHLLIDVVFMETVGMRPVVVHGGGAAISRAMDAAGLKARFIQGRRYTDDATRDIVENVLAYETNEFIARRMEEFGGRSE